MKKTKENNYPTIFAIVQIVLGVLFMAIPASLEYCIPYVITTYLSLMFLYDLFMFCKKLDKKLLIESLLYLVMFVGLLLLYFLTNKPIQVVAIVVVVYCILRAIKKLVATLLAKDRQQKTSNLLGAIAHFALAASIITFLVKGGESATEFIVIYGVIYLFEGSSGLYKYLTKSKNIVFKVTEKTYAKEIISGLVIVMILASSILPFIETGIVSFGDAMWYCFALVTTIGFGDIAATTALGRFISVFVGIYGIIIFALITSIIVNVYTEKKEEKNKDE